MIWLPKVGILALKEIRLNRKKGQDQEQKTGKRRKEKDNKDDKGTGSKGDLLRKKKKVENNYSACSPSSSQGGQIGRAHV